MIIGPLKIDLCKAKINVTAALIDKDNLVLDIKHCILLYIVSKEIGVFREDYGIGQFKLIR